MILILVARLVVVGDGGSSKTELCIVYTTSKYPSDYVPTVFDNYVVTIMIGDEPYTLGIFDTTGQENYDRLRSLSYPQTNVFLMCFSKLSPASFEHFSEKWAPEIIHHCPGVPFILVGITDADAFKEEKARSKLKKVNLVPISQADGKRKASEIGALKYLERNIVTKKGMNDIFFGGKQGIGCSQFIFEDRLLTSDRRTGNCCGS